MQEIGGRGPVAGEPEHAEQEYPCSDDGQSAQVEDELAAHLGLVEGWERHAGRRRQESSKWSQKPLHPRGASSRRKAGVLLHPRLISARVPPREDLDCPFADDVTEEAASRRREGAGSPRAHVNFEDLRASMLREHGAQIRDAVARDSEGAVVLSPAPVAASVGRKFAEAFASGSATLVPAYHGSNSKNYASICARGLLVPGSRGGKDIAVAHGTAHGRGVYTANGANPWLSMMFCRAPKMLVCGVADDSIPVRRPMQGGNGLLVTAQSSSLRHVGDAIVVSDETRVAPLFTVSFSRHFSRGDVRAAPVPTSAELMAGSRPLNRRSAAIGPGGLPAATHSGVPGAWVRCGGKRKVYHDAGRQFAFRPPVAASPLCKNDIKAKRRFERRASDKLRKALRRQKGTG